jgi:nitrate reductase gamma subunit
VDAILEFARGPLFRLVFSVMVLGLLRIFILDVWGMLEAYRRAGDKVMPWRLIFSRTLEWLFPARRLFSSRPVYSAVAIVFHAGLLVVPAFLGAHILLWKNGLGVSWISLPKGLADFLTLTTIAGGLALFVGRVGSREARSISRRQDILWPLLLMLPFLSGYVCANMGLSPGAYKAFLLVHVLSGELVFVLLPFTKLAHCVLVPLSQMVMTLAWKFPAAVDDDVATTLGKKGARV